MPQDLSEEFLNCPRCVQVVTAGLIPSKRTGDGVTIEHRIVTIAARNYLSRAAVLAKSIRESNPALHVTILLVDAIAGEIPSTDYFDIATASDLPLDMGEFRRMAMMYDVTEFCTSVKPWALEMLLDRGATVATYLDPDIEVFGSLDPLANSAEAHSISLTPHTLGPFPRDGLQPTEQDIMLAGSFNLGYISVSTEARQMLSWWKERLRRDSITAPERAIFVDQRWVDLVPSYFSHDVIRDPGYNVAYWNLHERELKWTDGGIVVNDEYPLRFFHYSGYRADRPWVLNKYYSERPRVILSEQPVAYELCRAYVDHLSEAETNFHSLATPYRYGFLADESPIGRQLRAAYRSSILEAERNGDPLPPIPFGGDDSSFLDWLRSPARPDSDITNYLALVWQSRADLQQTFWDPFGEHVEVLQDWARLHDPEARSEWLHSSASLARPAQPLERSSVRVAGVNVSGYFMAELGVGEAGRRLLDAVRASGYPYEAVLDRNTLSRQNESFDGHSNGTIYPISVAAVNADMFSGWVRTVGASLQGTYMIGHWAWELEDFQAPRGSLDLVDEVWANSDWTRRAIAVTTDKPVYALPLPVKKPDVHAALDRFAIGLPDSPYFLFVFDHLSGLERKNPVGLVEAFSSAFQEGTGPILVIKSVNAQHRRSDQERLRLACQNRKDIRLIEEYLDGSQVGALMNECMSYVSLHRSEGFGFTMAEAMSYAKPVIATGYSGNTEFMTAETSLLVSYELIKVGPGSEPYPAGAHWAAPDLAVAAQHMRWVWQNPLAAAEMGARAREHILAERSVERTAQFVRERVESIMATGAKKSTGPSLAALNGAPATSRALEMIHTPPQVGSRSRFPRLAKRYRQLLYRALAHHDERTNEQITSLAYALADIERHAAQARTATEVSESQLKSVKSALDLLGDQVSELETFRATSEVRTWETRVTSLDEDVVELRDRVDRMDAELEARPFTVMEDAGLYTDDEGRKVMGYRGLGSGETAYVDFEDVYRGSEEMISLLLKEYLPLLGDREPVIDIGCGRGEFLTLLDGEGIRAIGVDIDESMYERCRSKGLDVRLADGLEFLRGQPAGSAGGVVSIEVIEHLPTSELERLFELAFRVLQPGGRLLVETVNPHSPAALKAFWLDLGHVRPLYPEALLMLAQRIGYEDGRILFPAGTGNLYQDRRQSGSYALLATKGYLK